MLRFMRLSQLIKDLGKLTALTV